VLVEGKEQGFIREKCDANRVAHGIFSVIVTSVFRKFTDDDIGETAHNIAELLLYGVASE
jgi:hypothetical protein